MIFMGGVLCVQGLLHILMASDLASWDMAGHEMASKIGGQIVYDTVIGLVSLVLATVLMFARGRPSRDAGIVLRGVALGLFGMWIYGVETRLGPTSSPSAVSLFINAFLLVVALVTARAVARGRRS